MKPTVLGKIGTHSSTILVLWKEWNGENSILAMEKSTWDSAHWSYRRLKSCNFWKTYFVDLEKSRTDFLFLIR